MFPAVLLCQFPCGLRVDDDLHKPPQDGGSCRPGRLFPSIMLLPALHRKLRSGIKIQCIPPDSAASAPHSQPELLLSVYISLYDLHFAATCKSRLCIHPPIFFQPLLHNTFFQNNVGILSFFSGRYHAVRLFGALVIGKPLDLMHLCVRLIIV